MPVVDTLDIDALRADTPGCAHRVHLNNAGAALMPEPVLKACRDHLTQEATHGGYEAAAEAKTALEDTYDAVAALLQCHRDEVALMENATRAWDMAFYSLSFDEGDRILTSEASYASNYLAFLQQRRRTGVEIVTIPRDDHGQIDLDALEAAIDDRTALIALTHVPTNNGLVNPAAEVGRLARAAGVPFLLDACQSAGQRPLDVDAIGCDMLSATSRKYLRGPRGMGFLYVRRALIETMEPPIIDLHAATWTGPDSYTLRADARRFETWEKNYAAQLGLRAAVRYALDLGLDAIQEAVQARAARLRGLLGDVPAVTVQDTGAVQSGIVTFTVDGQPAAEVQQALRAQHINVSVSPPSSTLLDATRRSLPPLVRASVHYYNTTDELDVLQQALLSLTT
ncbi:MAG: aminotransferase class V-fold PLP-dependent enzyme [Bacteroidetes bacterium]|jgi:selenocysteine lyase/cysteine desulfurase|nr:aminotransferase class V-fold PLP-dependent enzyme [Bacteroidota bacterium]